MRRSATSSQPGPAYIGLGMMLPALVLAFADPPRPSTTPRNLPAGWEHVGRVGQPLSLRARLGLVLLVPLLLIATAFSMTFLLLAFALPVVFTVYYVVRILRTRRTETPMVARRLSIPSQRERPVQSRSYWTVNPNTGDDDNA